MSEAGACWHAMCTRGYHGMDDRVHETAEGRTFRAPLDGPAPIDWPARFRAAAAAAKRKGDTWGYYALRNIAHWLGSAAPRDVVEAIGDALLGREVQ